MGNMYSWRLKASSDAALIRTRRVQCRAAAAWAENMAISRLSHGNLQDLFHPLTRPLCCELELETPCIRFLSPPPRPRRCIESSWAPEHMVLDALCLIPTASTGLTIAPTRPPPEQQSR